MGDISSTNIVYVIFFKTKTVGACAKSPKTNAFGSEIKEMSISRKMKKVSSIVDKSRNLIKCVQYSQATPVLTRYHFPAKVKLFAQCSDNYFFYEKGMQSKVLAALLLFNSFKKLVEFTKLVVFLTQLSKLRWKNEWLSIWCSYIKILSTSITKSYLVSLRWLRLTTLGKRSTSRAVKKRDYNLGYVVEASMLQAELNFWHGIFSL